MIYPDTQKKLRPCAEWKSKKGGDGTNVKVL